MSAAAPPFAPLVEDDPLFPVGHRESSDNGTALDDRPRRLQADVGSAIVSA